MAIRRKTTVLFGVQHSLQTATVRSTMSSLSTVSEPSVTPDLGSIERLLASPYLTPTQMTESFKSGSASFSMEFQGVAAGTPATQPVFHNQMVTSGFRGQATMRCVISTVANGPIKHGSHFTQTTSSVEGWNIGRIVNGDSHAYLWQSPWDNRTFSTAVCTFDEDAEGTAYGSAPTLTPASKTDSWSYWPQSTPLSSVEIDTMTTISTLDHGALISQGVSPNIARGRVELPFNMKGTGVGVPSPAGGTVPAEVPVYFQHFDGTARFQVAVASGVITAPGGSVTIEALENHEGHANCSASIKCNYDGPELGISGAKGNVTFRLKNGDRGLMEFEYTGAAIQPTDETPPTFAGDGAQPPPIIGGTYLLGTTYNPRFSEISIATGNEVSLREDANAASGYIGSEVTARKPTISIDPELVQEVQFDMLEKGWSKGTFRTTLAWGAGAANGNNFRFDGWQVQVEGVSPADRTGQSTLDTTLALTGDGDDEAILHVW